MSSIRKSLTFGCALAVAGCAQGGLGSSPGALGPGQSMLPSGAHAPSPMGRHGHSGSNSPEIYVFQGTPDAQAPLIGLTNIGNTLYGTTTQGGANNLGAVYSVTTGGAESVLHSFAGGTDGFSPEGPLTNVNGVLYGTAYDGGTEHGTIFTIDPSNSNAYKIVYNFGTTPGDCVSPSTAMIYVPSKNALYGTGWGGGADGEGCIFKLSLASKKPKESVVYSFTGASNSSTHASAPVFFKNALFVTTPGGGANGHGAVLAISFAGTERLIYSFANDPDGAEPQAALVAVGNVLYGTTFEGGQGACIGYAGCGTIFRVTAAGKEKVLYRFKDSVSVIDGTGPQAAMIADGNTLYGTTPQCSGNGCGAGVVFSVTTSGAESILYHFTIPPSGPMGFPQNPYSGVISVNGTLYGTTDESTNIGYGTVYAVPQ